MTSESRAFLICLCLPFFICPVGCEQEEENTASLSLRVSLTPSMAARAQQDGIEVRVYVNEALHTFHISSMQEEYTEEYPIHLDSFGWKDVRVEYVDYVDSVARILYAGRGRVDIGPGENNIYIELGQVTIALNPTTGPIDSVVQVKGENFGQQERVRIDFAGIDITSQERAETDDQGGFTKDFRVPENAFAGEVSVQATGLSSNRFAEAQFTIIHTTIQLNPAKGWPGDEVIVTGQDFDSGEKVKIAFGGRAISTTPPAEADAQGHFGAVRFTVPADASEGETTVQAIGVTSGRVGEALFTVIEEPPQLRRECVDFSSLDVEKEYDWFRVDSVEFELEYRTRIEIIAGVEALPVSEGNLLKIKLPERSTRVTITARNPLSIVAVFISKANFEAFDCNGNTDARKEDESFEGVRTIILDGQDICSVNITTPDQINILEVCYQFWK
jgi:hypothetical protein